MTAPLDAAGASSSAAPVRVLLADDSTTIRSMLSALLGDVPEIDVCAVAVNGAEAVDLSLQHRPDVIIMDVQMPELDGIEATRRILATWPEARVILNSAYGEEDIARDAADVGAVGYMSKGQRPGALVKTVLHLAS